MHEKVKQLEAQITEMQKELDFLKSQILFEELETYTIGEANLEYGDWCFI